MFSVKIIIGGGMLRSWLTENENTNEGDVNRVEYAWDTNTYRMNLSYVISLRLKLVKYFLEPSWIRSRALMGQQFDEKSLRSKIVSSPWEVETTSSTNILIRCLPIEKELSVMFYSPQCAYVHVVGSISEHYVRTFIASLPFSVTSLRLPDKNSTKCSNAIEPYILPDSNVILNFHRFRAHNIHFGRGQHISNTVSKIFCSQKILPENNQYILLYHQYESFTGLESV